MPLTTISVMDATTHAGISGASVFINGQGQSGTTDGNGQFGLTLVQSLSYGIAIKADGYQAFSSLGLTGGKTFTAFIQPNPPPPDVSFTLNITPEDKANNSIVSFAGGGTPILATYISGGLTLQLPSGSQNITASIDTFQPVDQAVDTSTTTSTLIQLIAIADTAAKQPIAPIIGVPPTTEQLLPPLTKVDVPEFVPPNNGQGTYFTMTQARMYIGDLFIDELNFCQFVLQNNKIPIYGYASRDFDGIAQGKALVQGQFGINFISEGYLFTALKEYDKLAGQGNAVNALTSTQQQSQARLLDLVNKLQNPDPAWTPAMFTSAKTEINNLAASLGPAAVQSAKAGLTLTGNQVDNILPGNGYQANATYGDIEFDIVLQYSGAGRTVIRKLERCHLISNESIMDHSGAAIIDSYGFVARRLR